MSTKAVPEGVITEGVLQIAYIIHNEWATKKAVAVSWYPYGKYLK